MNRPPEHITVDGETIPLRFEPAHTFVVETRWVAKGYGVEPRAIREHKREHADELIEGKHWVVGKTDTLGGIQNATLWTKRGIVRLGFFIKSERAKRFRDAAEDLVIDQIAPATELPCNIDRRIEQLESNQLDIMHALAALRPVSPSGEEVRAARSEKARAARSRPPTAEELRQMELPAVAPAAPSPPPAPAPLLLTSGRVYKGRSVSMHPEGYAAAVARAEALGLTWSANARRCMKIEQQHCILATPGEAAAARYSVTLPSHLPPQPKA